MHTCSRVGSRHLFVAVTSRSIKLSSLLIGSKQGLGAILSLWYGMWRCCCCCCWWSSLSCLCLRNVELLGPLSCWTAEGKECLSWVIELLVQKIVCACKNSLQILSLPSLFMLTCRHFWSLQYLHWLRCILSTGHARNFFSSILLLFPSSLCCDCRHVYFLTGNKVEVVIKFLTKNNLALIF